MKSSKAFLLFCFLSCLTVSAFGSGNDWQGVNPNQPISIGEVIYRNTVQEVVDNKNVLKSIAYTYDGCDVNSIKIKIKGVTMSADIGFIKDRPVENRTMPLNTNNKALLKVETLNETAPNKEVLITVIDDFYRINAEEHKK